MEWEAFWWLCFLFVLFMCDFSQVSIHSSDASCCFLLPIHFGCQCLCSPSATSPGAGPVPQRTCPAISANSQTSLALCTYCHQLSYGHSRGQAKVGGVTKKYLYSLALNYLFLSVIFSSFQSDKLCVLWWTNLATKWAAESDWVCGVVLLLCVAS